MKLTRQTATYMLFQAGISAGLAFFSALTGASLAEAPDTVKLAVFTAFISAGSAFFLQLAIRTGVK